jgi:molecular chaperone DnaK
MVKEAEANAEADKKEREKVETRNEADSMIYSTEKTLKDMGDKVNAAEKQQIEEAIAALKRELEGGDLDAIKAKTEALKQASYKIAEEMYKQQAASGQAGAEGAGPDMGGAAGGGSGGPEGFAGAGSASGSGSKKGSADDVDYEVVDDDK